MREGALPSPINQARAIQEVLALAKRESFRVNLIEAYDQPWKRRLEGTVGGHWGLYDAYHRKPKFVWGAAVSNHPQWGWQATQGVALAALVFLFGFGRGLRKPTSPGILLRTAAIAASGGALIGWTIANVPLESLTIGDWLRSLAWTAVAMASPLLGAAALGTGTSAPSFACILSRGALRPRNGLVWWLGIVLIATAVLSIAGALGLVFDPRYRDFPFAPLTGAAVALALSAKWRLRPHPPVAEAVAAATLVLSALYIAFNEGAANWQALWFGAGLLLLALTLLQARDAPD
jgi:glucan 1,3-beta-glucosidase